VLQALSRTWRGCLESGGDLDKAGGGPQWLLITYAPVRDSDPIRYWKEGCELAKYTMTAIIREAESEELQSSLYQEAEGRLNDI
jgi:hypothetical protein